MALQSYRELDVWQKAMTLAEECYKMTKPFPKQELFGMTSQIRRSAVSVPANIAEGQGRLHSKEFVQHLGIAKGSINELETHLILSQRVGLLPEKHLLSLLALTDRISRMISGLRKSIEGRT